MTSPWYDFSTALRIEPDSAGDFAAGFRAEVADPVWFLGRQWQMGEHQGEDAASPVRATLKCTTEEITHDSTETRLDPRDVPAEALIEGEPGDWWTVSRRIRVGRDLRTRYPGVTGPEMLLDPATLQLPYSKLLGPLYDGKAIWDALDEKPADLLAIIPQDHPRTWAPSRLAYHKTFTSGSSSLAAVEHTGGEVDWWTIDAMPGPAQPPGAQRTLQRLPTRLSYRGSPHPRWWQIENAEVDLGGHPPDRTHLGTLLLIELVTSHADDWFLVPVAATIGTTVTIDEMAVVDAFDRRVILQPPSDWSIFRTAGLQSNQLVLFPTTSVPLVGPVRERVEFAVDQDANVAWAIERIRSGRHLIDHLVESSTATEPNESATVVAGGRHSYRYRPAVGLRQHWYPYVIRTLAGFRSWVQATYDRDLFAQSGTPADAPDNDLINNSPTSPDDPVHSIDLDVISESGVVLERRHVLARDVKARPVLWRQRDRLPLREGPTSGLKFDVAEPQPDTAT